MNNVKNFLKVVNKGYYAVDISEREEYDTIVYGKIEEYDSVNKTKRVQIKDKLEIEIKQKEKKLKKVLLELTLLKIEKTVCSYAIKRGKNERFIKKQTEYLSKINKLNVLREFDDENTWIVENGLYKAIIEKAEDTITIHLLSNPIKEYIYSINVPLNSIENIFKEHLYNYFNDSVDFYDIDKLLPYAGEEILGLLKICFLSNRVK